MKLGLVSLIVIGFCAVSAIAASRPKFNRDKVYIDAATVLQTAADDPDPVTQSQAIEALAEVAGAKSGGVFMEALKSQSPAVRFAAAMAIGDSGYEPAKETLLRMAAVRKGAERDKRVLCAIIYALHKLGNNQYVGELGALLVDPEKEVRANVAFVMGRMDIQSGLEPLRYQLANEANETVRLNILEALARLQDESSRGMLESYTKWNFLDYRLFAIEALSASPTPATKMTLINLIQKGNPTRVRVAAAAALAGMGVGDEKTYSLAVDAVIKPEKLLRADQGKGELADTEVASLQQLGAKALGRMRNPAAIEVLLPLLSSSQSSVRVSAARAILKLMPEQSSRLMAIPTSAPAGDGSARSADTLQPSQRLRTSGAKQK